MTHIICRMFDNSTEMLPRIIGENSDNLGQAEGPNRSHVMIRELARETEDKPRYQSLWWCTDVNVAYKVSRRQTTVYITSLLELRHPLVGSRPFAPDSPGQLDVLGHNGHPLGMDGLRAGNRVRCVHNSQIE